MPSSNHSAATPVPTVHIVDDDPAFRAAVARLLRASGYQVALYESGSRLLQSLPDGERGCILLDLQMPDLNGLDLQERLLQLNSILPIVFLTGHGDIPASVRAIKGGAEDFLSKLASKDELFGAIDRALIRYDKERERLDRVSRLRALAATLTPREKEVFSLVVHGKMNKEIAFELGTAERTIKAHRHSIMEKLQVHTLAEAVVIAERLGMTTANGRP